MLAAAIALRARHESDRFEYIPKASKDPAATGTEWRIRCNDCPGKVRLLFYLFEDTLLTFSILAL